MKTLTELSGITVRRAAAAIAEARRSLPGEEPTAVEAEAPAPAQAAPPAPEAAPAQPAPAGEGEAAPAVPPADATVGPAGDGEAAVLPPPAAQPRPKGRPPEPPETEAVKAALDAAVSAATGLTGDRLARLRDAVKVADRRIDDVRLVRVFGPEEPVPGATTLNGFQYLVDVAPASMRQTAEPRRERGGRGDRGRSGGGGGKGAPKSGGFSMDSLKDDRKGQRSGPGGRGRPGSGGGKPR
jgi:hypothetical protein